MIISNAQIGMVAQQDYREDHSVTESLEFWFDRQIPATSTSATDVLKPRGVEVDLSCAGSLLAMHRHTQTLDLTTSMDARSRLNMMIIEAMYKAITGKELNMAAPVDLPSSTGTGQLAVDTSAPAHVITSRNSGSALVYRRDERYQERENLAFHAAGVVRTADGREINFSVALKMSREFVQESNLQLGSGGQKIDPLVINFDGLGASLSQTRFEFDLDSDGATEQIATLRPGSGYLALDRNGDGTINNGSELFGPRSGRGFAELAAYDEDGNNFIDEGDSIYHQLRIWMTNEDGSTQLAALGDKNIGAIFLGHVSSPFQLKDAQNNLLGEVVNSGVYLMEDGKTGVVQEINLTV